MRQQAYIARLTKWTPALYFLAGQAGWFACVLSAAHGRPLAGILVAALLVAGHLYRAPRPLEECKFLAIVMVIGALWESALVRLHLLSYPSGTLISGLAPDWIVALWGLFAAQFNTTYTWLKTRVGLAAIMGAIAGPLTFRAGASLGALRFEKPLAAALALAAGWTCLLPLLAVLSRRWDGVRSIAENRGSQ